MAGAAVQSNFEQPTSFAFTAENLKKAQWHIAKYPEGRQQSAIMPLLWLAQQQHGNWLPIVAIQYIADMLGMPYMRAYEVASFYTQYNLQPLGRYHIQCCTTTPCWLAGSDEVLRAVKDVAGISHGQTSADGMFTMTEVECLGACANAPMIEVNAHEGTDVYYEDLTYANTRELLLKLKRGEKPVVGSQTGRVTSEPTGGLTTLKDIAAVAPKKKTTAKMKPEGK